MRVKVGNQWFTAEPGQPLAVEFTDEEIASFAYKITDMRTFVVVHDQDKSAAVEKFYMAWLAE